MSIELVTGHKGKNHITSEQIAALNSAIFGNGGVILNYGNKCKLQNFSSGVVRIADGVILFDGRQIMINNYYDVNIPITFNYRKTWNIYIHYSITDNIENVEIGVISDISTLTSNDLIIAEVTTNSYAIESFRLVIEVINISQKNIEDLIESKQNKLNIGYGLKLNDNTISSLDNDYNNFIDDYLVVDLNNSDGAANKKGYINGNSSNQIKLLRDGEMFSVFYALRQVNFVTQGVLQVTLDGIWKSPSGRTKYLGFVEYYDENGWSPLIKRYEETG